jgi:hypothetical protein
VDNDKYTCPVSAAAGLKTVRHVKDNRKGNTLHHEKVRCTHECNSSNMEEKYDKALAERLFHNAFLLPMAA